jgi:mono/diheme cytochrome c family protein
MRTRPTLSILLICLGVAQSASVTEEQKYFALKVRPLLKEKCLACHGEDPEKLKGDFDMRTKTSFLKGGETGEVPVIPGKPETSPLFLAVSRVHDDTAMPPKENDRLNAEQVKIIKQWINSGAVWLEDHELNTVLEAATKDPKWSAAEGVIVKTSGGLSNDWTQRRYKQEDLWAYQPLPVVTLPKQKLKSTSHPVDAFINEKMAQLGIAPAPLADRRTLLRRATYDLTGLPPKPEEMAEFLNDPATDETAFAKVIERLLGSPHYGEQWARHWLDVVRYADSSGFANDYERGNAWRYRDYVVRSFNADKPYDQFIKEQIAGDEINPEDPEMLIAAGFLRSGPWELTGMEVAKVARQRFLDDVTDLVGQAFLSQTLQCFRCHDHKFDPLPTRDYYSFQACFSTTQVVERPADFLPSENLKGFAEEEALVKKQEGFEEALRRLSDKSVAAARAWYVEKKLDASAFEKALGAVQQTSQTDKKRKALRGSYDEARALLIKQGIKEDQLPPRQAGFSIEDYGMERVARKGLERLKWEFDRYQPIAFSVYSGRTPDLKSIYEPLRMPKDRMNEGELEVTAILAGGDPFSATEKVNPGVLSVLAGLGNDTAQAMPTSIEGRRLALASWIASPNNPLTSRSIVNRIWQWHFGQPIAGNPNNFGATGKKPTHPELLDWLARDFINQGWSFKNMHRRIMMSEAYRRGGLHPDSKALAKHDPEGLSLAVFKPRRLTAEELRDSMLAASGELNPVLGGIPARPEINLEAALQPRQVMGTFASAWQPHPLPEQRHRRSLYALKIRGLRDPFMEVFNEPSPEFSCEARDASNVTPQVFGMFNSESTLDRAAALAWRVKQHHPADESAALEHLFQLLFSRAPTEKDLQQCLQHWHKMTARHETLVPEKSVYPTRVIREAVEENTGENFSFTETLDAYENFVPDRKLADVDAVTRGLAEVALVLLNSNEFAYLY